MIIQPLLTELNALNLHLDEKSPFFETIPFDFQHTSLFDIESEKSPNESDALKKELDKLKANSQQNLLRTLKSQDNINQFKRNSLLELEGLMNGYKNDMGDLKEEINGLKREIQEKNEEIGKVLKEKNGILKEKEEEIEKILKENEEKMKEIVEKEKEFVKKIAEKESEFVKEIEEKEKEFVKKIKEKEKEIEEKVKEFVKKIEEKDEEIQKNYREIEEKNQEIAKKNREIEEKEVLKRKMKDLHIENSRKEALIEEIAKKLEETEKENQDIQKEIEVLKERIQETKENLSKAVNFIMNCEELPQDLKEKFIEKLILIKTTLIFYDFTMIFTIFLYKNLFFLVLKKSKVKCELAMCVL